MCKGNLTLILHLTFKATWYNNHKRPTLALPEAQVERSTVFSTKKKKEKKSSFYRLQDEQEKFMNLKRTFKLNSRDCRYFRFKKKSSLG